MATLDRISIGVEAAIRVLVVVIFAFMLGTVLLDVAARNFAFRVRGLDELARYSQIWFIFLVTGVGARYGELLGTDAVVNALPRRLKVGAWLVGRLLMFVFLGLLAYYAWQLLEFIIRTGQTAANLRFPMWWAYLPLFVGTALMFASLFVDLLVRIWSARHGGDLLAPPDERKASLPWN
jgi:TRAP-type C4-dicarboxylate transport system permease small subunit